MGGVGIRAMGRLMERVMAHVRRRRPSMLCSTPQAELALIAPKCRWTEWHLGQTSALPWNELQNTPRHISALSNFLVRTYVAERTGRK